MRADRPLDVIETEAARWLLRRDDPSWSSEDAAALAAWLAASASHRVAFIRLKSVWRQAGRLPQLARAAADGGDRVVPALPQRVAGAAAVAGGVDRGRRGPGWRRARWAQAAAIVALATGALLVAQLWPLAPTSYHTPVGGLAIIPMDDGSSITLNTDSAVKLRMTNRERRVDLLRGEAFFEVASDPSRVFAVYVDDRKVVAVGTKFSVRIRGDAVQVAVTEGRVRLESRPGLIQSVSRSGDRSPDKGVPLLTPGTVAIARPRGISTHRQPLAEVEQTLGWRGGTILLQRVTLKEAVDEFNRYSLRKIELADPDLEGIRVGGNFRTDNIDGFVRLLQEGFAVRADQRADRIVLSRPHPHPAASRQ